ncbi:MAG: UbiA family prenyltransferase [Deltaproteobacteria bacterium]|nr:UbiA family prenyltransferase [Deltaproteobacteria bacterium]
MTPSTSAWAVFQMVTRPHILAIAGFASLVFGWLFDGAFHPLFPALVAADWFVVNLLNRVVDLPEDARNGVPGTAFLARHGTAVTVATCAFFAAVLAVGHLLLPAATPLRVAFHVIGFAYNYRVIPWPGGRTRFKQMYALKNTSSALLFVLSVILLPLYGSGHAEDALAWERAGWLIAFFFPLELTYEVLYDLRDVDGDRAERIPTFPVVHGERWAYAVCFLAVTWSMLVPVVGHLAGPLRLREAVLAAGALQQFMVFLWIRRVGPTGPRVVNVTYLGASQLASYCAWVAVGLPVFDA